MKVPHVDQLLILCVDAVRLGRLSVGNMSDGFTAQSFRKRPGNRPEWAAPPEELDIALLAPDGEDISDLTVIAVKRAMRGLAQAHCLFKHCVEHRGEVAGRGIDDAEDL